MAADADIYLYTDGGSGARRDFGGSAAIVLSKTYGFENVQIAATTDCGAYRSEFLALLAGLHGAVRGLGRLETVKDMAAMLVDSGGFKPVVMWFGDNKALVDVVAGKACSKSEAGLWAQLEWYREYFDLQAVHVPRNSTPDMEKADRLASAVRVLLKEWCELQDALGA